ncbi:Hypothetical predicted protein, partial [Drosophila guanche]
MLSSEIYTNTTTSTAMASVGIASAAASVATTTTTTATTLQVVKSKKRRKRRKRAGHAIGAATTTTAKTAAAAATASHPSSPHTHTQAGSVSLPTVNGGRKCKAQYFQHDNREYLAKYESFHLTSHHMASGSAALNYAAVAKKFKPLRPALASGAKKTRRPGMPRKLNPECACACQSAVTEPVAEPSQRTAAATHQDLPLSTSQWGNGNANANPSKINIDGQILLELLKHSSNTLLETLLGAGSAVAS